MKIGDLVKHKLVFNNPGLGIILEMLGSRKTIVYWPKLKTSWEEWELNLEVINEKR